MPRAWTKGWLKGMTLPLRSRADKVSAHLVVRVLALPVARKPRMSITAATPVIPFLSAIEVITASEDTVLVAGLKLEKKAQCSPSNAAAARDHRT